MTLSGADDEHRRQARAAWTLMLCAGAILMITMGARGTLGLFVSPLNSATGLGIVTISFAMAVGQFVWGASQPVFGAVADKYGPTRVILLGGVLMAAGVALTPFASSDWALVITLGVLTSAGAGAGSFSILLAAAAQRLPPDRRAFASGFINAGGSFGQFIFAPAVQGIISAFGWINAMFALALAALGTLPIARMMRGEAAPATAPGSATQAAAPAAPAAPPLTLRAQLRIAASDRSYWCLHAGFFTCGFHIAFLVTHLPGEVQLCSLPASVSATSIALIGLFNIAGSFGAGALGQRYRMKYLLFWMYAARAAAVALYLLAPKVPATFYVFAAVLGLTWLATVPPTAGLVGKLFGARYLGTLFGLTLLSHQVGGFFGAWLGGIALQEFGHFDWMWHADIALALAAALVNLPIRESKVVRPALAAA